ncbi:MAG: hypothetical protein KC493_02700 [Bacteriovoracaceae bacterium]|nr:hypothetical protein [Bacteriovoracaceae bacterium]
MTRIIIPIVVIILLIGGGIFTVSLIPYHIYTLALSEGVDTDFVKTNVLPSSMYKGSLYSFKKLDAVFVEDESLYKTFHFDSFTLPFPFRHPLFKAMPLVENLSKDKPNLGLRLMDQKGKMISEFLNGESFKFYLELGKHKLFNLPVYKKMILDKSQETVFRDMFEKDITIPDYKSMGFINYIRYIKKRYSYDELVYNLFILKLRNDYLPKKAWKIAYYEKKGYGIAEINIEKEGDKFLQEIVFILHRGNIYSLSLKSRKYTSEAEAYRRRLMQNLNWKESISGDSSVPIYSEYRELEYQKRIDQEGMLYLFAAWSHEIHKKEFLKEMIQFLERGKENTMQLTPLYQFAYKKFGTTFSLKDKLKEDAKARLDRKIKEELEDELRREKQNNSEIDDSRFESEEKKIEYFLDNAKEAKNSDEDEDVLVVE